MSTCVISQMGIKSDSQYCAHLANTKCMDYYIYALGLLSKGVHIGSLPDPSVICALLSTSTVGLVRFRLPPHNTDRC